MPNFIPYSASNERRLTLPVEQRIQYYTAKVRQFVSYPRFKPQPRAFTYRTNRLLTYKAELNRLCAAERGARWTRQ